MNLSFPFSLKHIALVKIAIAVFNNSEIKVLIQEQRTDGILILNSFECQQEMFEKLMRKLSNVNLPFILKKKVAWSIIPIANEFEYWRAEHIFLTEDNDTDYQCFICWRSFGMIDWQKTAKNLIQNKMLDTTKRFLLSCLYNFKDDVFNIWNEMSASQKECILQDKEFSIVEHWIMWLKHGIEIHWAHLLRNYVASSHQFFHETPFSLSCFSPELTTNDKQEYFRYHIRNSAVCNDDLLVYIHQMEPNERMRSCREHVYHILFFHLEWPFQDRFMHMANSMWKYLRKEEFLYLFLYLTAKLQKMRRDFDYSTLAQEFWQASPAHFKEFVRNVLRPRL
ncbi:hypothetical protein HNY73_001096 [Argiope bruennichi]|uniref:Uncharacterized protein n=1 Tax=Argiope bruennichi TaxID=94029 RepID=A0A8T0G090_ARGBR|nr:hypothetical protein HNY73_001096 [Argiope bruennichi]